MTGFDVLFVVLGSSLVSAFVLVVVAWVGFLRALAEARVHTVDGKPFSPDQHYRRNARCQHCRKGFEIGFVRATAPTVPHEFACPRCGARGFVRLERASYS